MSKRFSLIAAVFSAVIFLSCSLNQPQKASVSFYVNSTFAREAAENLILDVKLTGDFEAQASHFFENNLPVVFEEVPLGVELIAEVTVYNKDSNEALYSGKSEPFHVLDGENKVKVLLEKLSGKDSDDPDVLDPADLADPAAPAAPATPSGSTDPAAPADPSDPADPIDPPQGEPSDEPENIENSGSITKVTDLIFSLACDTSSVHKNTASEITLQPSIFIKNGDGTENLYYYQSKVYTQSSHSPESLFSDESVEWKMELYSQGTLINSSSQFTSQDNTASLNLSYAGLYTLKVSASYLGIVYDAEFQILCED